MTKDEIITMCKDYGERFGLRPVLIQAIVETESNYETRAMRYEPGYRYTTQVNVLAQAMRVTPETEEALQKFSYGLMQIMGGVARELGFTGYLPDLLIPQIGMGYACKHLKNLTERYGSSERAVVASYNAGSPIYKPDGVLFANQQYVDKVYSIVRRLENVITN